MQWKRSPDNPNDYSCPVGRVYEYQHGPSEGRWFWSMTAVEGHDRRNVKCDGVTDSREDAFWQVRSAWERSKLDGSSDDG